MQQRTTEAKYKQRTGKIPSKCPVCRSTKLEVMNLSEHEKTIVGFRCLNEKCGYLNGRRMVDN